MERRRDWSTVAVFAIVGVLLFFADPLGIRDRVLTTLGTVFGPFKEAIILAVIVGVTLGAMLYLMKRIIKP